MEDGTMESLEHREHAEHAAHSGNPMLVKVSMTIAILAVAAATVGSLETIESGAAISMNSQSVLFQNRATDQWSYFQAQSVKKNVYDVARTSDPAHADAYDRKARDYEKESEDAKTKAEDLGRRSEALIDDAERHEHRHHVLTLGATMLHVSIAVATIAIIIQGRSWPWHAAIVLGTLGSAVAAYGYLS